jgi:hypothetical protein
MLRIATLLIVVACLTVIGCQPPEGMAGPTKEEFDALKMQVETLQTDVAQLYTAMDSLTTRYNTHIEKFHKGGTPAPTAPKATKPPQVGR